MPFTDEFNKLRRHFSNLYNDKARAETFAFQEAFKKKIPTFEDRKRKFKKQIRESLMFTEV
ncbi:hypothetical protein LCGC14_1832970 [marine sediment metagenome]|uniref:Uncharacterized protein n=1 Tax=marine sediment metagenome TaxID=412755 RepID=A0A0F9GFP7_9ZZZZ